MAFLGDGFVKFFKGLSKNNTTDWFNENRKTYESEVKKPFAVLVEEVIRRIQKYDPDVKIKPSDAIMRINKDIRFSKDKTPYNTYVAANISKFGKKDKAYPGFYFQIGAQGVTVFGGAYAVENDMLQRIRSMIAKNPKQFASAYSDKVFRDTYKTILGEQHKRLPDEFKVIAEKEPLIANKQFYYTTTLKPDMVTSDKLPEKLMELYVAGKKVNDFLKGAWE